MKLAININTKRKHILAYANDYVRLIPDDTYNLKFVCAVWPNFIVNIMFGAEN